MSHFQHPSFDGVVDHEPFKVMQSGKRWYLLNPRVEDVDWWDISNGLSSTFRFDGQTQLTVAQHLVNCAIVAAELKTDLPILPYAFLHDAHEAYTGDISKPMKNILNHDGLVSEVERRADKVIYQSLELTMPDSETLQLVKEIDGRMLATEWLWLMPGHPSDHGIMDEPFTMEIKQLPPHEARAHFVSMFNQIFVRAW